MNTYLLYGLDTYRSRQKLNAIKAKYIDASLGDTNLAQLDGATAKADELVRQIGASPFLAPKRLVIIHNLLTQGHKDTQKTITDLLPKIPKTSVVIFYEESIPDKRGSLFQKLNLPKISQEFVPLDNNKLTSWIRSKLEQTDTAIAPDALILLIQIVGPDLYRMEQEIDKLSLYSPQKIDKTAVGTLIHQNPTGDIFQLIDAIALGNSSQAIHHIHARINAGDNPLYILSMIVYGFRTLILVEDSLRENPNRTSAPGVHPYVFKKTCVQIKHFSAEMLHQIYHHLGRLDYECKTGIIEPKLALELFVAKLTCSSMKEGQLAK